MTSLESSRAAVLKPTPNPAPPTEVEREARDGSDVVARLLLCAALIVGLVRFFRLGEWSLWFDEAATWTDAHLSLEDGEISNPLGYRIIAAVVDLLGGIPDEFSLRILPAVMGWCVIPAMWWAFKPWIGSRRSAAAALLVAASSWHVYWSQNARFYTIAQFISLVGAALVLRGLWRGRTWLAAVGLAVAGAAALFHPSAVLLLPALAIAPWLMRIIRLPLPRAALRPALMMLFVLVAGLALKSDWLRTAWVNYTRQKGQSSPELSAMIASAAHFVLTSGFYITPLWLAGALVGVLWAAWRRETFILFATVIVVLVIAAALVSSTVARISAQYVFVVLPWVAILVVAPIDGLLGRGDDIVDRRAKTTAAALAWLAILVLPTLVSTGLYFTVRKGERPQWREAYQFVWNLREKDDLILGMEATVGEFYLAPQRTDLRQPVHVTWLDKWRARLPEIWARHARRAWYILNPEQLLDWEPRDADDFRAFLRQQCRLVKCFPLYVESRDLSVWVYIRD